MTMMKAKKQKAQEKCVILRELKFEDHKNCLQVSQLENKITVKEIMFCKRNYKITLSSNDDKRIQSIDSAETYAY